jgi:hypothetical protein
MSRSKVLRNDLHDMDKYNLLSYPYTELGPFRLPIYPHFAVVNAAVKLRSWPTAYIAGALATLQAHGHPDMEERDVVDLLAYPLSS